MSLNEEMDHDDHDENEVDESEDIMESILSGAEAISMSLLPAKSAEMYLREYEIFSTWRSDKKIPGKISSEAAMLVYFNELKDKYKPNTLWVKYSMLRATILRNEDIDIVYPKLIAFRKKNYGGYKPKKAKIFEGHHIARFIREADDREFLCTKVILIFGVYGATRSGELTKVKLADVKEKGDIFLVEIVETKTNVDRSFTVQNQYAEYIRRYKALRKPGTPHDRFFVNYQKGRCTVQPIGKNKFYDMPKVVATFLGLENPKLYTGHSFRRSSSTILVDGGGDLQMLKKHGGWKGNSVAEGYVDASMATRMKINETIAAEIDKQSSVANVLPKQSMAALTSLAQASSSSNISGVLTQSFRYMKTNIVSEASKEAPKEVQTGNDRTMQFENLHNCTFNFY